MHDPLPSRSMTLYRAAPLETTKSTCTSFIAAALYWTSRELVPSGEVPQCLEEAEQQTGASGDVPPPFQIVISTPFVSFSSLSLAPFLNPLSSPFPRFP